ncbi:flavanone 3-dioxygenase 3-like [Senna tora]|uniref:Flavanone 3-dioxygenase 3-like n=1 Tax=Senna tora TaxID=362788 RepID=A0A834XGE5_9FABA|nr:flavanone 3-dioxygenase 3-like [Senna tora]
MEKRLMLGEEDDIDDDNNNVIASSTFTCAMSLDKLGVSSIPRRYVLPHSHRPNPNVQISTTIPLIDLSSLHHHQLRAQTISHIRDASQHIGLFQVSLSLSLSLSIYIDI